jgi:hypothetical protein
MSFYLGSMQKLKQQACCPVRPKLKKIYNKFALGKTQFGSGTKLAPVKIIKMKQNFIKGSF